VPDPRGQRGCACTHTGPRPRPEPGLKPSQAPPWGCESTLQGLQLPQGLLQHWERHRQLRRWARIHRQPNVSTPVPAGTFASASAVAQGDALPGSGTDLYRHQQQHTPNSIPFSRHPFPTPPPASPHRRPTTRPHSTPPALRRSCHCPWSGPHWQCCEPPPRGVPPMHQADKQQQ